MTGTILETNLKGIGSLSRGKVRDIYQPSGKDYLYLVATDRISAFDSILPVGIPHKGHILTQISKFCFLSTKDYAENHFLDCPDPNVMVVRKLTPYPVEAIVRGYLMGSAWRAYKNNNKRDFNGTILPDGLSENQKLETPIITPTTKAEAGKHDEDITDKVIVENGLVPGKVWEMIKNMSIDLYNAGNALAKIKNGVVFDTKFEWGYCPGHSAVLMDEIFTPDSSRIGDLASYRARFEAGERPEWYDKEYTRDYLKEQNWMGAQDGTIPEIPDGVIQETSRRYQKGYEIMTGREFKPPIDPPTGVRIKAHILTARKN